MFKNKNIEKIILVIIIILTFIRVMMWLKTPIYIYTEELNDDQLLYEYGRTMSEGNWLGGYNQLTLVKGLSFSFFQVLCNKLMIPYPIGLAILNILSALIIAKALSPKVHRKWLYLTYLVVLFSPTGFTTMISQRNYRNAIIPFTVLLVFGAYIGLFLRRDKKIKELLPWAIVSGICLTFFWFVKEDSIWVLPFVGTISVLILIWTILYDKKSIIQKSCMLVIPIIVLLIASASISFMNYKNYGVFAVNDKSNTEFGKMMSNLFKIEDDARTASDAIWITKNMLEKAYAVSPTFAELKANMDVCYAWTNGDGEVNGDLIVWKVRYVMSIQGYYENAPKAQEFCKKVNSELEEAFKNGSLQKDGKLHVASQVKGLSFSESIGILPSTISWLNDFSKYDSCGITNGKSVGKEADVRKAQAFLGCLTVYKNDVKDYFSPQVRNVSNLIVKGYQFLAVPTNILAIIGYIVFTISMLVEMKSKNFEKLNLWFVATGVCLSAILLSFELNLFLSFFTEEQIIKYRTFYSAGAFPLIEVFKCISVYFLIYTIVELIRKKWFVSNSQN